MARRTAQTRLRTRSIGTALTVEYRRQGKTYRHTFKPGTPLVYVPSLRVLAIPAALTTHRPPFIK